MSDPFYYIDKKAERLRKEIADAEQMLDECMESGRGVKDAELALEQAEEALTKHLYHDQQDGPVMGGHTE